MSSLLLMFVFIVFTSATTLPISSFASNTSGLYEVLGTGNFTQFLNFSFPTNGVLPSGLVKSTYTVGSAPQAHIFTAANVVINGGYLNLHVPGGQSHSSQKTIRTAQVTTSVENILYASVRTTAMFSSVPGTCQGLFFYHNDTQEMDIEYLSNRTSLGNPSLSAPPPLQFTNQPDTHNTSFAPSTATTAFHEYRVDWVEGVTMFLVDGVLLQEFSSDVPNVGGRWMWNNWANGNAGWATGPPKTESILKIREILIFYNTTS